MKNIDYIWPKQIIKSIRKHLCLCLLIVFNLLQPDPKPIPGPPGPEGPEGPRGAQGEPGRDGRDASLSAH